MFKDFDFSKMGEMLAEASKKAEEFKSSLASQTFTAKAGGGLVSVTINGADEVLDINIDDELLSDKESLQLLLISAVNDAIKTANEAKQSAATGLLGGFAAH